MARAVIIPTSDGEFVASFTERGLAWLAFPGQGEARNIGEHSFPGAAELRDWRRLTTDALRAVLAGRKPKSFPPLDWRGATEFQQAIWRAMLGIPTGQTLTYTQLAAAAGRPSANRAAGGACGANPIPVLVPCHRVVAAGGRLGGFSGGLDWKRLLLSREGVSLADL